MDAWQLTIMGALLLMCAFRVKGLEGPRKESRSSKPTIERLAERDGAEE